LYTGTEARFLMSVGGTPSMEARVFLLARTTAPTLAHVASPARAAIDKAKTRPIATRAKCRVGFWSVFILGILARIFPGWLEVFRNPWLNVHVDGANHQPTKKT
jgi:hypothetical protein